MIELVAESDRDLSVRTLAREIAAREQDVPLERATGEPYRNVYNALSQTHLSTLSDADVIIYDSERQTVAAGPNLAITLLLNNLNQTAFRTLQNLEDVNPDGSDS
ncbi:hypothetical protein B1756_05960 [Natrarchaeobaculum aegyptiacum]|uniref:DUF7344 domain-containing protein n=1 Tax=Natrarchaeobaculum aegyptiacum TaxID=745377 RepID=A0A2Z2I393_9EURY|nr:hypothetical protein B1756_05960 [Natrarchaeobaculum aegyptiacum]